MANFFRDNEDLRFYLERGIDWGPIVELTEYLYRSADGFANADEALSAYRDILELIGEFAAAEIAPHAAEIDREGVPFVDGEVRFPPRLDAVMEAINGLELHGMTLPRELGGQNLPMLVFFFTSEIFARADSSVMAHFGFHSGIAMAMLFFSMQEGTTEFSVDPARITKTRFADFIEEIRKGEAWGAMDITEPDAGSDMAALRAVGEQDESGQWRVSGNKIFITSGHGKYHFVIARTEKAGDPNDAFAGLNGLSMFLVPIYEDGPDGRRWLATVDRLEEKLGHHGSATAALTYDKTPAYLVGKRGEGFKYMLTLMNNARLGVGFESLGVAEAAVRMAKAYAAERRSMGKTIDRHEMIADYIDEMEADLVGIRALAVHGAVNEELAQKYALLLQTGVVPKGEVEAREMDLKRAKRRSRRVTPLLKYLAAEKAVEIARKNIQIHGGVGFTKEYGAEKLLRDAMVFPIYEGTSQIQALMAMKDTLTGIMRNPRRFATRLAQAKLRELSARDPLERRVARIQSLSMAAQQHLMAKTAANKLGSLRGTPVTEWPDRLTKNWDPKRDFSFAMLHAERLTRLLADEAIVEILWAQAERHADRREWLERYLDRAEPRARYLSDQIHHGGQRLLEKLAGADELRSAS